MTRLVVAHLTSADAGEISTACEALIEQAQKLGEASKSEAVRQAMEDVLDLLIDVKVDAEAWAAKMAYREAREKQEKRYM